jgi:hypothetical protein
MQSVPLENNVFTPLTKNWATYDISSFPEVKVKLSGKIENWEDFRHFLDGWRDLYKEEKKFTLHFDTSEVGSVSMKYAFEMRNFIRELKSSHPRFLESSYITVNSRWVRFLLRFIFFLEKPVAPVIVSNLYNNTTTYYNP